MNTRLLLILLFVWPAAFARGEGDEGVLQASPNSISKSVQNTSPAYWNRVIAEQSEISKLKIGRTDFSVSGPLIDVLHRRQPEQDRSLGRRILGLPVVRLFVPRAMPQPPGGGKYFRWGQSDRPWTLVSENRGIGESDNPIRHESRAALISIDR
jgi:hypothetical protein